MEQEVFIKERDELLESFKSEFSKLMRKDIIWTVLLGLFIGLFIYNAVSEHIYWLQCTILCVCLLVPLCHNWFRIHQLANAGNAQDFVTTYDKHRKIGRWIYITCIPLFIIVVCLDLISGRDMDRLIKFAAVVTLCLIAHPPFHDPWKYDIERLRKLVQQTNSGNDIDARGNREGAE